MTRRLDPRDSGNDPAMTPTEEHLSERIARLERRGSGGLGRIVVLIAVIWLIFVAAPQSGYMPDGRPALCWQDLAWPWESQPRAVLKCVAISFEKAAKP